MIVGIDTRENSSLLNTDTIVVASYNYDTNSVTMLSIPRDFHVEVNKATHWFARINAVYGTAEKNAEGTGLDELQKTVEEITQQEIQYYAMVDFKAFVEIIDSIGGITVDVENSFIDYMYPLGTGYQTVSFTEGIQEMDGETALQYARSRHSMQNGEGSDYARAARQQKVIIAVKDKILSTETLTNPVTLMNLISSVADNIKVSEFNLEDIQAGLDLAKEYQEKNGVLNNFVLDPSIGNGKLVEVKTLASGAYAIGPKLGLGIYTDIHEFLQMLAKDPELYAEDSTIRVYNTGLGYQATYQKVLELQEQYPYLNIVFSGTLYSDKEGITVYTHDSEPKPHTVEILSTYLNADSTTKPEYITNNLNGEDVTILLGKEILVEETTSEI
jgi:LCP family protein required for cell wall assembly